ncbi:uncharacterized protein TRIVIDRAFT_49169 [Trichoderma virens Gv29-8]|uniref:DUF4604 domain-containing protein n=1 Tax=Hypocrea virens (strain Gv29-8 / FGSC 10586) TaxID=413071 RepID=G9MYJ7_HYPVG|nr:uncharacterized protein TRIVIDRAFT_49169 [Trichoderma virens Gv29-8]EHK20617.1 hypothetical protein TRIVIDRAFT_49169 [Trichoderma virens Gv29-8]
MSQKINSKNLSYNSSLPPFLAALRAQASGASGPDPILSAQRRSGKKRSSSEEAEDVPLVVDENGNTIEDLKGAEDGTLETEQNKTNKAESEPTKASIGGRKRKVGKVIGEDAQNDAVEPSAEKKPDAAKKSTDDAEQATNRKTKKKAKKIKLSFDEDEG